MENIEQRTLKWDKEESICFAPGLIDLQVNGVNGTDFNDISLTKESVLNATEYLLSRGVTTYFPTVITNSDERIVKLFEILSEACDSYPLVKNTIGGFHLEGPFISPKEGAKGAHDVQYIKPPDWELFKKFQDAAKGNIKLITLSPEWEETPDFIMKCRENNVLVSMGHSLADAMQIKRAVDVGMSLSTHLGNGVPLMIKRHPNILWEQLAENKLTSMIIVDGHHLPDAFIKVVLRAKKDKVILVSDATCFAGKPPGVYDAFIGGQVVLNEEKRLSLKSNPDLLAGAAKDLLECVETMIKHNLASVEEAWKMASERVRDLLENQLGDFSINKEDRVEFKNIEDNIKIIKVIKNSQVVYEAASNSGQTVLKPSDH